MQRILPLYWVVCYFFVCDLNISEKIKAKPIAAAIPPAVAVRPPVKIPRIPCVFTALIAPFANEAPKPTIGTFIPAFANADI